METQKVDIYLMSNQKNFPADKIPMLREALLRAPDDKFMMLQAVELKDTTTMIVISVFLGSLGIDRFMLGDVGMGVLKLLTGGVCGILTIYDWCTVMKRTREQNFTNVIAVL